MRIISGKHRGRRLKAPLDQEIRPTSDRLRETIFNMLSHRFTTDYTSLICADIYAGTGALGLEALSRGAAHCTFVEKSKKSRAVLLENIERVKEGTHCDIVSCDARKLPKSERQFNLVFLDPPYNKGLVHPTLESLVNRHWLLENALIVIETTADETIEKLPSLQQLDRRSVGESAIWFFQKAAS